MRNVAIIEEKYKKFVLFSRFPYSREVDLEKYHF